MDTFFQSAADRSRAEIVVGVIHLAASGKWNEARWYLPATALTYAKHHMVPLFESSFTVGTQRTSARRTSGL